MAKKIEVQNRDGSKDVYESTLTKGYKLKETDRGVLVARETERAGSAIESRLR